VQAWVLVPVKAFAAGKARLAPALSASAREALARTMAERVIGAAAPLPVAVACDDDDVATWARAHGAEVVWTPGVGLDGAVQQGCELLVAGGAARVVVSHADLPRASGLVRLADPADDFAGSTFVPDRRDDGTNVICVPTRVGFEFSYGPGSFQRHIAETERLGLPFRVVREPRLGWDVDHPADLDLPAHLPTTQVPDDR
jgi:2-phospho-L-lactate/phosphoenolpyruvate guanylyltransferase